MNKTKKKLQKLIRDEERAKQALEKKRAERKAFYEAGVKRSKEMLGEKMIEKFGEETFLGMESEEMDAFVDLIFDASKALFQDHPVEEADDSDEPDDSPEDEEETEAESASY